MCFNSCLQGALFSITCIAPRFQRAEAEESKKGKPSVLGLATPSHTDLKWSPVIDQFQLRLERTSPFIHVLWSLPLWLDCTGTGREIPPPWQDKMKEDGRAVRFLDRHSREPTLWMVMDCLYARLPPCLILFILWAPRAQHLPPRSQGLSRRGRARAYSIWVPLVEQGRSNHSESEVTSTAPSGCTQGASRGGGQKRFRAWQRDKNVRDKPLKLLL